MFLVGGSHAFTVIEQGFIKMMAAACPRFKLVSRHTIRRDIMALFDRERAELREIITNSLGRVSFTTDNWKSDVTKFSYICITCHYVDDAWRLNKRIIWFKKLNPPYDGATIADEVHLCFREWKVDTKIMCLTLDNASYNDSLINTLRSTLLPKGVLPLFGTFFQVRCCAHILNLIVQAGLKLIDKSVDKIRDGIQYIKVSSNRIHKFYETAQNIYHLNEDRKLRVDMPVRWNSTYTMLENSLYFKDALLWYGNRDGTFKSNFSLTLDEWEKVGTMHDFLKTFYDVTCIMSGMKYPTSNLYFKCVFMVQSRILKASTEGKKFMAPMLSPMKEKFDKYWADYNVFLSCAAVLDPRCKLGFVSYCYGKLYAPNEAEHRVDEVKKTLVSLFAEYSGVAVRETPSDGATNSRGSRGDGADMFNDCDSYIQSQRTNVERSQLDLYLEETPRRLNDELDVLEFWSKSSMRYPELASMARDVLAVPISSVASEQAFSMSRKVIAPNRASLRPKTIEALMCLQDWYRWKMSHNEEMSTTGGGPSSSHAEELPSDSENDLS